MGWFRDLNVADVEVIGAAGDVSGGAGDEFGLVGEVAEDAFVEGEGFVLAAEFAVGFGEVKNGGGGEAALLVGFGNDGFVLFDRGGEVVVGFFFEEAFLEAFGKGLGRGEGCGEEEGDDEEEG